MSRYILYEKESHRPIAFIDYEKITDIKLYTVTGTSDGEICSYHFIADIYAKSDSCTHWNFYGEDYDCNDEDSDGDSYYHICGPHCLEDIFLAMTFAWEVCRRINGEMLKKEGWSTVHCDAAYRNSPKINKMIEKMLEDFEIEETKITPILNIKW